MNVVKCIFCNQYLELTKKGKNGKNALLNTLLLITALLTVYTVVVLYIIDLLLYHTIEKSIHAGQWDGSDLGKLFGLLFGGFIFLLLKVTIGRQSWYEQTINEFNGFTHDDKEAIAKKGMRIFFYAFIPLMVILLMVATGII